MEHLQFIQIEKDNDRHYRDGLTLYADYLQELDQHQSTTTSTQEIADQFTKRVNIQGLRADMHFELCYEQGQAAGFAFYAIDLGGIRGLIDAGYGYIMEYYVAPDHRRRGIGRSIYEHVQAVLSTDGAQSVYLTPDSITGEPFWSVMGFQNSGKMDPDNYQPIFIKEINKTP